MPLLRSPNGRSPLMIHGVARRELKNTFKGFKPGPTAAWKVPTVDLLLAFGAEEAGNLITAAKLAAATITTDTGAWTVNNGGAALTHTRVTTAPISRRCALKCGGTDYVSGYGYQIDMTGRSGATGWESFQRGFQSGKFGASLTALFKYEALQPGTDDIGLDTMLFQGTGGGYAVAQQAIPFTDSAPGTLAAHGQVGAVSGKGQKIPIPNNTGFFEIHLKYDYAASLARVALVDATTGVLIGTSEYPTDPQELFNVQFQDYLISYGGKITAGMIGVDYTTQAYPIGDVSVPVPTAVSVMQIGSAVGVLFSTLTNTAQIERNSGSGWSTLTSTYSTLNGANTYFDATATAGVSYQYRVTSILGTMQSASVPTGSIVPSSLAYTSLATDPFTRADAGNLGANWNEIVAGFQVVSNKASATLTDGLAVVEYGATTPPSDARASITFRTTPTVNTPLAIYMRYNGGTDDGYYMELIGSALSIKKNTAGVTSVKASGTVSFAIGDVISWEPFGSGLAIYKNSTVVLGAFDPSFTTASVVTIVLNTIGAQTFAFDDFTLESISIAVAASIVEAAAATESADATVTGSGATITEAASAAATASAALTTAAAIAEAGSASDTPTAVNSTAAAIAEAASAADTSSAVNTTAAAIVEAASAASAQDATTSGGGSSVSEAATAADAVSAVVTFAAAVSEAAAAADTSGAVNSTSAAIAESAGAGDTPSAVLQTSAAIAESAAAVDTLAASFIAAVTITESTAANSAQDAVSGNGALISEGTTAGDSCSAVVITSAAVIEGATAGDNVSSTAIRPASVSEGTTAGDSCSAIMQTLVFVTEGATAGDTSSASGISFLLEEAPIALLTRPPTAIATLTTPATPAASLALSQN